MTATPHAARCPSPATTTPRGWQRVVDAGVAAGLDGVLVTPGPDLVWLTGYQPTAITERMTHAVPDPRPGADTAGADPRATGRRGARRAAPPSP